MNEFESLEHFINCHGYFMDNPAYLPDLLESVLIELTYKGGDVGVLKMFWQY